jgi:hypothetical protein
MHEVEPPSDGDALGFEVKQEVHFGGAGRRPARSARRFCKVLGSQLSESSSEEA